MQSSPSLQGYQLPSVIDPPGFICYTVKIPNDPAYIAAFIGALYDTSLWVSWQRDAAHTGTLAAQKMRKVWLEAVNNPSNCGPIPGPAGGGLLEDFSMPLRVDCDCNVFVTCCDGTEKQILTADQVNALLEGSLTNGQAQPQPGGGCVTKSMQLTAGKSQLIPVPMSTGDTIQLSAINGAVNEDLVLWYCQSGQLYYAGECQGPVNFFVTDPFPLVPHGAILIDFGSGPVVLGDALYTVPGGISGVQPVLSINMSFSLGANGFYTFLATICNNQTVTPNITYTHGTGPASVPYGTPFTITASDIGSDVRFDIAIDRPVKFSILSESGYVNVGPSNTTNKWAIWYLNSVEVGNVTWPAVTLPGDFPSPANLDQLKLDTGGPSSVFSVTVRLDPV